MMKVAEDEASEGQSWALDGSDGFCRTVTRAQQPHYAPDWFVTTVTGKCGVYTSYGPRTHGLGPMAQGPGPPGWCCWSPLNGSVTRRSISFQLLFPLPPPKKKYHYSPDLIVWPVYTHSLHCPGHARIYSCKLMASTTTSGDNGYELHLVRWPGTRESPGHRYARH